MKILSKKKIIRDDCVIKKYKFLGFTFLRKEKSLFKQKYNFMGVKVCFKFADKLAKRNICIAVGSCLGFVNKISRKIDIIIPIYNGYEYLEKLFESIKENTDLPYRLLVIDDCSTDERVSCFLEKQREIFKKNIVIKNNVKNLGFVKSVNELLKISENDVVLVNTDVILPKNWASRLFYPIFSDCKAASVTPFSNAATIFSLPEMGMDNAFRGDLEKVNSSLKWFLPDYEKLKFATGVGFCMAMSRRAIRKVGFFDEIFGKGYGEENDWCQRACKAGFYNTLAANLFVWHKHGGSFLSEDKKRLIKAHRELLIKKYPDYDREIKANIENPYYKSVRFVVEMLYINAIAETTTLWFDHTFGGGTDVYTKNIFEKFADKKLFIRVQQAKSEELIISYQYKNYHGVHLMQSMAQLKSLLNYLKISEIVVNNLASYPNIENTLLDIADIKEKSGAFVSFRLHDFQCICPTINMMARCNKYCGGGFFDKCGECLFNNSNVIISCEDVGDYQFLWQRFLSDVADEIVAFSESSKCILEKFVSGVSDKIKVVPHFVKELRQVKIKSHKGINIGVIGSIGISKGSEIVNKMADVLADFNGVNIFVIGKIWPYKNKTICVFGEYKRNDLPQLLEDNNIDIVFIPSVCPETFSYTTREAIGMEIPVCCYNLGGQADQIKNYKYGLILENFDAKENIRSICGFLDKLKRGESVN